jgi:hypothetical protein
VHVQPPHMRHVPHLTRRHALVQTAVLRAHRADIQIRGHLAVRALERSDRHPAAEIALDLHVVQEPLHLRRGIAFGDAGQLSARAALDGLLAGEDLDEFGRVEAAAQLELGDGLGALLIVAHEALVHAAVLLLHGVQAQHLVAVPDVHAVLQPEDLLDGIALERGKKGNCEFRNIVVRALQINEKRIFKNMFYITKKILSKYFVQRTNSR